MGRDGSTGDDLARIRALEAELRELRARVGLASATPDARIEEVLGDVRILELVPEFITIVDRELRIVYLNRARGAYSNAALIGATVEALMPTEEAARVRVAYGEVLSTGESREVEFRSREGAEFIARLVPVHDGGAVVFIVAVAREVTEARAAERALRASEARLRLALRSTGMGTWSWSTETNRVEWDETLCRMYGLTFAEAPRDPGDYLALILDEDRAVLERRVERALAEGTLYDFEHRIRRADGAERWLLEIGDIVRDGDGKIIGMMGGALDVTEHHDLQHRTSEAQKLEALGRLTSGLAHNFNNVLGVILPSVELARRGADPQTTARLDDIAHATERAAEMVRELLLFARGAGKQARKQLDLGELARRTVSICRATFGPAIALELEVEPELPPVAASANQLEQVLLNLLLNARDALDGAGTTAPRVTVRVHTQPGGVVALSVEDNGPGMDEATRARVFEPFFTTKPAGRGTGLGLSSAYAILAEHGGRLDCTSRVGVGTTFRAKLPATVGASPVGAVDAEARVDVGEEHVLVIDDEPGIRRVLRDVLEDAGYRVDEAASGDAAIARSDEDLARFALILVDHTMPGLAGDALLDALTRRVSAPVVALTGNPSAVAHPRAARVLPKPISVAKLLRAVRDVLDARAR